MFVDHRQDHLKVARELLSTLVYPVQLAVNLPIMLVRDLSESLISRRAIIEENARLKEQSDLLNTRLQRFDVIEAENRRLRALLGSTNRVSDKFLVSELLAVELEPFRQLIEINKGKRDGVFEGQPVVDAGGIIGQVVHMGQFSSKVLLITDPSHAVPVQIDRNGLRAIATGTGRNDALLLEHLPGNADVRRGDLVVSSGFGHKFPRGYPVGTISEVSFEPGDSFSKVTLTPSARLAQNREVLLLWPSGGGDATEAEQQEVNEE